MGRRRGHAARRRAGCSTASDGCAGELGGRERPGRCFCCGRRLSPSRVRLDGRGPGRVLARPHQRAVGVAPRRRRVARARGRIRSYLRAVIDRGSLCDRCRALAAAARRSHAAGFIAPRPDPSNVRVHRPTRRAAALRGAGRAAGDDDAGRRPDGADGRQGDARCLHPERWTGKTRNWDPDEWSQGGIFGSLLLTANEVPPSPVVKR